MTARRAGAVERWRASVRSRAGLMAVSSIGPPFVVNGRGDHHDHPDYERNQGVTTVLERSFAISSRVLPAAFVEPRELRDARVAIGGRDTALGVGQVVGIDRRHRRPVPTYRAVLKPDDAEPDRFERGARDPHRREEMAGPAPDDDFAEVSEPLSDPPAARAPAEGIRRERHDDHGDSEHDGGLRLRGHGHILAHRRPQGGSAISPNGGIASTVCPVPGQGGAPTCRVESVPRRDGTPRRLRAGSDFQICSEAAARALEGRHGFASLRRSASRQAARATARQAGPARRGTAHHGGHRRRGRGHRR